MTNLIWFSDIDEEAVDSRAEVKTFDKAQLKHVETKEENTLPGAGGTMCISTLVPWSSVLIGFIGWIPDWELLFHSKYSSLSVPLSSKEKKWGPGKKAIFKLPFTSVLQQVFLQNHWYENVFCLRIIFVQVKLIFT